jgi:ketosteroid isomerase-like protein
MAPSGADAVRAFIDAFNAEDLDALVAVLDPEVEIQTSRGIVIGHDEARRWATRNPAGELHQHLVLDDVRDEGAHVVAQVRRRWAWREEAEVAHEQELAVVATMRGGRIARWQPFEDLDQARQAAGL